MEDWVEILKNNKKNISVGEDKLKDNLIVG